MKGWYKDSYRHYLAAKGIRTRRYFKFTKDSGIPVIENPESFKSIIGVKKTMMPISVAENKFKVLWGRHPDSQTWESFKKDEYIQKRVASLVKAHEQDKNILAPVLYYDNKGNPKSHEHVESILAAKEAGLTAIPVVEAIERPYKSTGFMKGEFQFTPFEKAEMEREERDIMEQGGLTIDQPAPGIAEIRPASGKEVKPAQKEIVTIDEVSDEYLPDESKEWSWQ